MQLFPEKLLPPCPPLTNGLESQELEGNLRIILVPHPAMEEHAADIYRDQTCNLPVSIVKTVEVQLSPLKVYVGGAGDF